MGTSRRPGRPYERRDRGAVQDERQPEHSSEQREAEREIRAREDDEHHPARRRPRKTRRAMHRELDATREAGVARRAAPAASGPPARPLQLENFSSVSRPRTNTSRSAAAGPLALAVAGQHGAMLAAGPPAAQAPTGCRGPLELGDVELPHVQHRPHHALRLLRVRSARSLGSAVGATCHERPKRSLSQPHGPSSPPSESVLQYASTSSWVSQFTWNEIASLNVNSGPPLSARKRWPSSSKLDRHHGALGPRAGLAVAGDRPRSSSSGTRTRRTSRPPRVVVEPQARGDLLHRPVLSTWPIGIVLSTNPHTANHWVSDPSPG